MDSTARKSIFELMKEKYDLAEEIAKIEKLLCKPMVVYTEEYVRDEFLLEKFIDVHIFNNWKHCQHYISCLEIREKLNLDQFVSLCECGHYNGNCFEIINYIEYVLNMINISESYIKDRQNYIYFNDVYYILIKNINILLDHINYEAKKFESEEKILVVEKNPAATSVAEVVEDELSFKVIEYNHHLLKGNLNRKKEILKALADKIEAMVDKFDTQVLKDFGFLVNNINIRHNNFEGRNKKEYIANMDKVELEKLYDDAYQIMLICILQNEYDQGIKDKVKNLRGKIK